MRFGLLIVVLFVAAPVIGCGGSSPSTVAPAPAGKKLTWEEYQKLPEDQRGEPEVVDNLDEAAKKKLLGGKKGK